ncbi:ATP-binding protein [Aliivibrio fischeri]|uniref:ATP-binding protein n=1 Tax=Aliivibrio fischeri TaxID=668 RepID=UPI0007C4B913|nr:ATP-binding protein [Aliivibrio fischeri]
MENFSAFPIWDENNKELIDGIFINKSSVCNKIKNKKCIKHYDNIKGRQGFHICPFGLTSYSLDDKCYSSIKIHGHYDVTKTKKLSDFLPTIPPQVFLASINKSKNIINKPAKKNNVDSDMIDFSIHEVRRFNGEIKRICEEILLKPTLSEQFVNKKIKSIFASSSLISVRLNAFDLEENPDVITSQAQVNSGIYKKFQKASHCLDTYAKDRNVRMLSFKGSSHLSLEMYRIFDLIPFVILENAVKYSPADQSVSVSFDEINQSCLSVTISSIGPCNSKDEIERIFEKKSRGQQAIYADGTGGGYGLYFAKIICDMHNINIEAISGPRKFELNGIDYGDFTIILHIEK